MNKTSEQLLSLSKFGTIDDTDKQLLRDAANELELEKHYNKELLQIIKNVSKQIGQLEYNSKWTAKDEARLFNAIKTYKIK